jgi:hypothetical protein
MHLDECDRGEIVDSCQVIIQGIMSERAFMAKNTSDQRVVPGGCSFDSSRGMTLCYKEAMLCEPTALSRLPLGAGSFPSRRKKAGHLMVGRKSPKALLDVGTLNKVGWSTTGRSLPSPQQASEIVQGPTVVERSSPKAVLDLQRKHGFPWLPISPTAGKVDRYTAIAPVGDRAVGFEMPRFGPRSPHLHLACNPLE